MNRIVFQIRSALAPDGTEYVAMSLEEPTVFGSRDRPLGCTVDDPEFARLRGPVPAIGSIQAAGLRLYSSLAAHQDIAQYLQTALQTGAGQRYPVYVEIDTPGGPEGLPWEVLCSPHGDYLGLDERWALARMVDPRIGTGAFYALRPPLRIAALLSCLGISAAGELAALRESIQRQPAGEAELLVIASEEGLIQTLRQEMARGDAPEIAGVAVIPGDLEDLQTLVADFQPHVLHLFCHGSLDNGPHVQLARKTDWQTRQPTNGLTVEAHNFSAFTRATDDNLPWLVVLNCCEGAGAAPDSQSLALTLAFEGVAPAVVAMREPVVGATANLVTTALYSRLLSEISDRIQAADRSAQTLDWAHLMAAVRDRIVRQDGRPRKDAAASTKEWTLPVIYVGPEPFTLQMLPAAGAFFPNAITVNPDPHLAVMARAARLEIEALRTLLTSLPPGQAPDLHAEAEQRITDLTNELGVGPRNGIRAPTTLEAFLDRPSDRRPRMA
jgi:CHAT domain